jgi:hypothetical protein
MQVRTANRAFRTRDYHRRMLTAHVVVMLVVVLALLAVNRFVTPDRFWAHWVAVAWVPLLVIHGGIFARSTLATMGGRRNR